jgi:hypothetical protein
MVEEAKGRHEDESHVSKLIHIVNSKYFWKKCQNCWSIQTKIPDTMILATFFFCMYRYGSFEDGDARLDEMEMIDGFEIALKKLTKWIGENIDKNKTRIFFAGSSPTHSW